MKNLFWLCKRGKRYFLLDSKTGKRESLKTSDRKAAEKIVHAKNEAATQSLINLALARAYLAGSDAELTRRTWQEVMDEFCEKGKESTRIRRRRAVGAIAFATIQEKKLVETSAEDLRTVLNSGGVFTNHVLRSLHNLALGLGWLPWPILPPKLWPDTPRKPKRAITEEEHQRILQSERNPERKAFYELLWQIGASQSDAASVTAENINWSTRTLSYQRKKTGEWCYLEIGSALEILLSRLPKSGPLFPRISQLPDRWRSAEFRRRCRVLAVEGISLHSYRYSWAERAYVNGVPERYAQAALGHSSRAVHWAYARRGAVVCPAVEKYEKNLTSTDARQSPTLLSQ
jgi:integrase